MASNTFKGEIRVASRIVDYLSSGLYQSPAACLKELVNNSYDADAQHVGIFVKPDADRIIIEDDGIGMTRSEFEKHFRVISESYKREDGDRTPAGRPKIGKIGIGFIAANEICDLMQIISTRKGSKEKIDVTIDFKKMRLDPAQRRRGKQDLAEGDYLGIVSEARAADHFTRIYLRDVRGEAKQILATAKAHDEIGQGISLYGMNPESVAKVLGRNSIKSWSQFDSYSQNMLSVALNVPVQYHDSWLPKKHEGAVKSFVARTKRLKFEVEYDGTVLRKPIVLVPPTGKRTLVSKFSHSGKHVSADGYFYAQHGTVHPQNLNGLLIRIRNAAVGEYDQTFLDYPTSVGTIFQKWISAEVWVDDRLEEAMNIDRRTLRTSHPAYLELQSAIHGHLSQVIKEARRRLYSSGATSKKRATVQREIERIKNVDEVGKSVRRSISTFARAAETDRDAQKAFLRKYSVSELYELIVEVAGDTLSARDADLFLTELIKRLRR